MASLSHEMLSVLDVPILNVDGLRMEREFVRHKALDCLGDLLLLGMPLRSKMIAYRPGHALSTKLVQALLEDSSAYKIVEANPNKTLSNSYTLPKLAAAASA